MYNTRSKAVEVHDIVVQSERIYGDIGISSKASLFL